MFHLFIATPLYFTRTDSVLNKHTSINEDLLRKHNLTCHVSNRLPAVLFGQGDDLHELPAPGHHRLPLDGVGCE